MRIWLIGLVGVMGIGGVAYADDDPNLDPEQPLVPVAAPPPQPVAPPPPQPVAPPPPPKAPIAEGDDPSTAPAFVTLDRESLVSRIGAELDYPLINQAGNFSAYKLDLYGSYVTPGGIGFYAQVPLTLAHVPGSTGVPSDSAAGIGDLEAGLLYAIKDTGQRGLALVAHFGLTAPIAASDKMGSGLHSYQANVLGATGRFDDLYLSLPGGFSVRAGLSALYKRNAFFARVDLAGDFNIDVDNTEAFNKDFVYPVVRLNFAGGYDGGTWSAGGELVNLIVTDRTQNTVGVDVLALNARLKLNPQTQPYVALLFPIDQESQKVIDAGFVIGIDARL